MKWQLSLGVAENTGELIIHTEYGPAFLKVRRIADNVWAFKGGTIGRNDGLFSGGIEVAYHRYFIKPDGTLKKKTSGIAGADPYTYTIHDGMIKFRLWENVLHVEKASGDTLEYRNVIYKLSGREKGSLLPVRSVAAPQAEIIENSLEIAFAALRSEKK